MDVGLTSTKQCDWCIVNKTTFMLDNQWLCNDCILHWQKRDAVAIFNINRICREQKDNYNRKVMEYKNRHLTIEKKGDIMPENKPLINKK